MSFNILKLRILPEEYELLEYISSTGTQYIDTGLFGSEKTKIVITAESYGAPSITVAHLLGDATEASKAISCNVANSGSSKSRFGDKTTTLLFKLSPGKNNIEISNAGYVFNGTTKWVPDSGSFTTVNTLWLFGCNQGSAGAAVSIYSASFYENNILVGEFVPARRKSDNECGMYDRVTGQFFDNKGTEPFAAGPMVESRYIYYGDIKIPRKYVEASSDDYPEKLKGWAILEIDGSENWSAHATYSVFTSSAPSNAELKSDTLPCVCDKLKGISPSKGASQVQDKEIKLGYYSTSSSRTMYLRNDDCSTVEDFKEYLSNNNLTVLYPLTASDNSVWTFVKNTEDNSFGYYNEETDKYVKAYDTTGTVIGDSYAHYMLNCGNS